MLSVWKWLDPKVIRCPWLCDASQGVTIIALHRHQVLDLVSLPSDQWMERWWNGVGWCAVKGKAFKRLAQSLAHSKLFINVPFSLLGLWRWGLQICCWVDCSGETMCRQKVAVVNGTLGICLHFGFYLLAWLNEEGKQRVGSNDSSAQDHRIFCRCTASSFRNYSQFYYWDFFFLMGCYFFCYCVTGIQNYMCLWYFISKKLRSYIYCFLC